ncbi:carbohydrate kinase family protein [Paludisphaera rhizosphaerae]|uniref:carbohydrate kinase family protein n=1 Tax=Paludisphaera rhizosphaerae TaxID=2711216 RepID=UPI0013EA3622|nr:carbohydrate kinase family protein [Paludisphaera rhizosphaerae]
MLGRVRVFGPAYLDRVLRVDRPLLGSECDSPLDQSVEGRQGFGDGDELVLIGPDRSTITIAPPPDWPGPWGAVELDRPVGPSAESRSRVRGVVWEDDLGGMGAGFAAALGGELVSALGPEDDPTSRAVAELLDRHGISSTAIRTNVPADWTLLVSSGPHGDKLAVGFRGCHDALQPEDLAPLTAIPSEVLVVCGLANRLAADVLKAPGPRLRVLAPAIRNVLDRTYPPRKLIAPVDVLCCNQAEWDALEDSQEIAARLSILVVTRGPAGVLVRFTDPQGSAKSLTLPAFPRDRPPRDTNHAGEAFAACFIATLMERGWQPESGVAEVELVREAAIRASAASALVLDRTGFGFPSTVEVDATVTRGRVVD